MVDIVQNLVDRWFYYKKLKNMDVTATQVILTESFHEHSSTDRH